MSVIIGGVQKGSKAFKKGIKAEDLLIAINGNEIMDILDYRFFENESKLILNLCRNGKEFKKTIRKKEYEEIGLLFDTYLMDKQRSCKNKCIFCFIDQMPKGMRKSLYFKDDDSRLSFLFGNYITLTNITEHEIERIIKMHISPINISVHTTNPTLRVQMMKNKNAGKVLEIIDRFNNAGIDINCQLVLVPGVNDGKELERSLNDLMKYENVKSVAAVPVGLTRYREGLEEITPFNEKTAKETLQIINKFADISLKECSLRRVFASDEFYILANLPFPNAEFYEDFLQLENGVGMCALLKEELEEAVEYTEFEGEVTPCSTVTGEAAYPLIKELVEKIGEKFDIKCNVYKVKNEFFGGKITVAGLLTGSDIIRELKGKDLGERLLIPSNMLESENVKFLDDVTVAELEKELNVKVGIININGQELLDAVLGRQVDSNG